MSAALHPVHRIKHVIDGSGTLTAGTLLVNDLITTVDAPVIATTTQCETGSKVHGIYLKVEVASNETDAGAIPNCYMSIQKSPANLISSVDPISAGDADAKKYIIHQEMVMLNNLAGGNPRVLFNGVIKIPRGYVRNGPNDRLRLILKSTAVNITFCFQCHYKEFR